MMYSTKKFIDFVNRYSESISLEGGALWAR